ncbi:MULTISPECIES: aldo/keto reductase [unclassified Streptomyces]|uniref:aldo/keto reductase n=1 Tax=unclassified Streptomyces TaxID=2593676 RepID=UPI00031098AD|nr:MULTISPECIES: aldo/keto reductase [unclassified Streptomyces]UNZ18217.1 aldo/keto reductase [Streptomyces sp. 891-h]
MNDTFRLGGDLDVHRLGFGAMRLPSKDGMGGPARDPETSRAVLRRAVELGVNHLDTADFYVSDNAAVRANTLIREALHPYPSDLVIATKVGPIVRSDGFSHGTAADMRGLVEANLDSLGLDRLDLVYLRIGAMAPPHGESLAERFEALAALREEGLIHHLGLSNVDARHLTEARAIAPVVAVQNQFAAGSGEADLLASCEEARIAFVPFFPVGGGRNVDDKGLAEVAARHGATVPQIGLARLLASSPVALAIPGTGSLSHLEENMAVASLTLTEQDLADLG